LHRRAPALLRAAFPVDRRAFSPGSALLLAPGIALTLSAGLAFDRPGAALIACGGALATGFGAKQRFTTFVLAPMVLCAVGMSASALIGSRLGAQPAMLIVAAGLWTALCGYLTLLEGGAWWIVMQWSIALFVAGAFPEDWSGAFTRAGLVLAGGGLQIAIVLLSSFVGPSRPPSAAGLPPLRPAAMGRLLRANLTWQSSAFRYAIRSGVAAAVATSLSRGLDMPNGYWVPLTAALVLRPSLRETARRGFERIAGTLVGGSLAGIAAAALQPGPAALAAIITAVAGLAYACQRVSYAIFSACLSAYVVLLLALDYLPEMDTVQHRIIATLLGGAVAMTVDALAWIVRPRATEPGGDNS
jgi:hypothetical protein